MNKTLVIFDIDGTLLFSNKIDSQLFAETFLSRYGKEFPSIDWNYFPHVTDHTIFMTAYQELFEFPPSAVEIMAFQDEFVERLKIARTKTPEEFQAVPGVGLLFNELENKPDFHYAIATGGWTKPAKVKLEHVGLLSEDLVISAADDQPTREDIVRTAMRMCKEKKYEWQREVYIGDALWDVRTCRNLNMPFIGLRREGDHAILKDKGAGRVFSNYEDRISFFKALHSAESPT